MGQALQGPWGSEPPHVPGSTTPHGAQAQRSWMPAAPLLRASQRLPRNPRTRTTWQRRQEGGHCSWRQPCAIFGGGMSCDCQPPCTPSNFTTSSAGCEPPPKGYASILYHGQRLSHCSEGWGTSIAVPMGTRVHNAQQQYKSTLINMGNKT